MRLAHTTGQRARRMVLAALHAEHGVGGRLRPVRAVARWIAPHTSQADVLTVADANADAITRSGNDLTLTDVGLQEAREHPLPRYLEA